MARCWYQYNGGSETTVGNYTPLSFNISLCGGGNTICAIFALDGGANPAVISANLATYFAPAKIGASAAGYPSAVGQKPYVYTFQL